MFNVEHSIALSGKQLQTQKINKSWNLKQQAEETECQAKLLQTSRNASQKTFTLLEKLYLRDKWEEMCCVPQHQVCSGVSCTLWLFWAYRHSSVRSPDPRESSRWQFSCALGSAAPCLLCKAYKVTIYCYGSHTEKHFCLKLFLHCNETLKYKFVWFLLWNADRQDKSAFC